MEITQFTYFQSIGSFPLKPVSVEITYGLERLAMYIQNKDSFYDMKWNDDSLSATSPIAAKWSGVLTTSKSIDGDWLRHFEDFEKEAKDLIARHLPLPAYDFVIKASHAFNMLDARGAISVTERTGYIARIRDLARSIAIEYVSSREKLGHPLLVKEKSKPVKKAPLIKTPPKFNPKKRQDFLLEIGSEQLPATFVTIGCANLEKAVRRLLDEHALSFEALQVFGTPQRLAILVKGLVEGSEAKETMRRGPAVASAFDASGKPTPQGEGFLKSLGASNVTLDHVRKGKVKTLKVDTLKDAEYLFATIAEPGKSTFCLLSEELPKLIQNLDFPKKMRWGSQDLSYARPLHWIVALFGEKVVPFLLGDVLSDRFSFGHAQLKPQKFTLKSPKDY